jgi:type VI secretion system ImpM family protein
MPARAILFGKLPAHGDFVARGLSDPHRSAWDTWLSTGLDTARARLGDAFEAAHDVAPPWRFVAQGGPFGPGRRAGAIAPSIDSVGRRFFIMVGVDGAPEGLGPAIAGGMEDLIYQALGDRWDADRLAAAAHVMAEGAAAAAEDQASGLAERWWILGAEGEEAVSFPRAPDDLLIQPVLATEGAP